MLQSRLTVTVPDAPAFEHARSHAPNAYCWFQLLMEPCNWHGVLEHSGGCRAQLATGTPLISSPHSLPPTKGIIRPLA